jgi:type I restriction enzyme S subunit
MSEELSPIPESWCWAKLPNTGEMSRGRSRNRPRNDPSLFGGPYPFIQTGDIAQSGGRIKFHKQTYNEEGLAQSRLWPAGTICITIAANIAESAILTYPACFPDSVVGIIANPDLCVPEYVEYFMRVAKSDLAAFAPATAQANINVGILNDVLVPLPPLGEQRRIVAKLEKLFGKVNACQQRLAKILVLLKRFRQSVLAAACSGGLTADWREEHPNTDSVATLLPESTNSTDLPDTWAWCALGEYVENLDGKRVPISAKERERRKGKFPYYGASGVIDSIGGFTHEGEFVLIGEDGANLLSRSTPIAFLAKGQIWVNNHAHVLKCKHSFPNAYLSFYINSINLSLYVTGTAQPKLNQANMNTIPIPVPPLAEQHEIVRRVEALFALADQIEARFAQARAQVDQLTHSLLARAFRGQLVPQDPNDEPAEKLLERIRKAASSADETFKRKSMTAKE